MYVVKVPVDKVDRYNVHTGLSLATRSHHWGRYLHGEEFRASHSVFHDVFWRKVRSRCTYGPGMGQQGGFNTQAGWKKQKRVHSIIATKQKDRILKVCVWWGKASVDQGWLRGSVLGEKSHLAVLKTRAVISRTTAMLIVSSFGI